MVAVVTTPDGRVVNSASMRTNVVTHGEEAAIALAIAYNPRAIILTDSQEAYIHFVQDSVSTLAHQILRKHPPEKVFLIWTPIHTGQKGNEAANATARGLLIRTRSRQPPFSDMATVAFAEYLSMLRLNRRTFPPPDKSLTKEDEYILRRLGTDTLPTLAKLHSGTPHYTPPSARIAGRRQTHTIQYGHANTHQL